MNITDGYILSEHAVRSMLGSDVPLRAIEQVLKQGAVLEEYYAEGRGRSFLKVGMAGDQPLHVVYTQDDAGISIILFSYVPSQPIWQTAVRRNQYYMESTKQKKRCFFCGGNLKEIVMGNFDYRLEGQLHVVKKIPAQLCDSCGEKYIDENVGLRLNELIKNENYHGEEVVKYIEY